MNSSSLSLAALTAFLLVAILAITSTNSVIVKADDNDDDDDGDGDASDGENNVDTKLYVECIGNNIPCKKTICEEDESHNSISCHSTNDTEHYFYSDITYLPDFDGHILGTTIDSPTSKPASNSSINLSDLPLAIDKDVKASYSVSAMEIELIGLASTDNSQDILSYRIADLPIHGVLSKGSSPNSVRYTPMTSNGSIYQDHFTYTVIDQLGRESKPAIVKITFNA